MWTVKVKRHQEKLNSHLNLIYLYESFLGFFTNRNTYYCEYLFVDSVKYANLAVK